ncbi:MAG: Omp28-related outer membrane protein [Bacteroidales bacterium]|nr:Omp28-related outer membrane protein [Bacteroidales bacterium]
MKRLFFILATLLTLTCCIGQKDDPETDPGTVVDPEPEPEPGTQDDEGGDYLARTLALDFTGTWCVNCPKMHAAISTACQENPDRIVPVSVHCLPIDPMTLSPLSSDLAKRMGVSAYPSVVVDLEPSTLFTAASPELLIMQCNKMMQMRGKAAGLKVSSTLEGGSSDIEVEMTTVREGSYTLHLLLLEDGISAAQTGASADYIHNDVLRAWLDAPDTYAASGEKEVFSASFKLDGIRENMKLVAFACREGIVDNIVCCIPGNSLNYQYEQ